MGSGKRWPLCQRRAWSPCGSAKHCYTCENFHCAKDYVHCRYGIREALAIASEEGLESMWERHRRLHLRLWEGLNELGLEPFVEKEQYRLVSVNTIKVQACHCYLPW